MIKKKIMLARLLEISESGIVPHTSEWHETRRRLITASDAGAVLGVSPFKTPSKLLREKLSDAESKDNIAMAWGRRYEPVAIERFETEFNLQVFPANFVVCVKYPFLGATPDGIVSDGSLLEVKCPFNTRKPFLSFHHYDKTHYYTQVQVAMLCYGADKTHAMQYNAREKIYKHEVIDYDPEFIHRAMPKWQAFAAQLGTGHVTS